MQGDAGDTRASGRPAPPARERPGLLRCMVGCAQLWLPFLAVWYGSAYLALEPHEQDEPWRILTPVTAIGPWLLLVATVRLLPPRDYGLADRARRALLGGAVWAAMWAAAAFAKGTPIPPEYDAVETLYEAIFLAFLYFHGNPLLLLPALYLVERPWILAHAPAPQRQRSSIG